MMDDQEMEAAREAAALEHFQKNESVDDFDAGFEAGWNARQPKPCVWTPVSEGLPPLHESVLVSWHQWGGESFVEEASLDLDEKWAAVRTDGYNDTVYLEDDGAVLAWMPLPEPYCGGKIEESE